MQNPLKISRMPPLPQDTEEFEVSAFALRLNGGQHWHAHLHHGLVSSSCNAMQLLVVVAHYHAIVHVAPSMASLSAKGYGRPGVATLQTWLFDDSAKVPYSASIATPFFSELPKQPITHEEDTKQPPLQSGMSAETLMSILSSDPATMLYDAAQLFMAERQPIVAKKEEADQNAEKQCPDAVLPKKHEFYKVGVFQNLREAVSWCCAAKKT